MDASAVSIEFLAKKFGYSLFKRGFSNSVFRELAPHESFDIEETRGAVLGLVLTGDLLIHMPDYLQVFSSTEEFFLPPNVFFQATAGDNGVKLLIAHQFMKETMSG
jgi:hypothetical protein